jgi:hypothetical protein
MKQILTSFILVLGCLTTLFSQQNRSYDTTFSVVTITPPQSFYLDSRIVSQINGRSRLILPVQLPAGTVRWYYSFAAMESKNEPMEWVSLAAQLTKLVDRTGITATFISRVVQPTGTAACDIYVLDTEGGKPFEEKDDKKWQYDRNTSRQNMTGGVVESYVLKPNFVIGLSNPSLKSGMNVRIEITAVVAKYTPVYNSQRQSKSSSESLWSGAQREAFFQNFQARFEGKLTPSVSEVSMCMLLKVVHNFTPEEFHAKAKSEIEMIISWIKKDCYIETQNESLEKRMVEFEEMKLKINELEQKGDFEPMVTLAERAAFEFPSVSIQTKHTRALLLSNQLSKALTIAETLAKNNPEDLVIQLNLAHIYLLLNQYKEAEKQYKKFQKQQLHNPNGFDTEGVTWEQMVASDFDFFIKNKIYHSSFDNIKKKLKIK